MQRIVDAMLSCFTQDIMIPQTCHKLCTSMHICTMLENSLGMNETCSGKLLQFLHRLKGAGEGG